jgi:hypothetical protein
MGAASKLPSGPYFFLLFFFQGGIMRVLACVFLLLAIPAAHALFLAGQSEQGGAISILCENQSQAFVSTPEGETRALPLDSDFQAAFLPQEGGPYAVQCGREVKAIAVSMPPRADAPAYPGWENILIAAGAVLVFLAALLAAQYLFLRSRTEFSKSSEGGSVRLCLRAGGDLREIRISDPQGGGGGAPLELSIPLLPAGARWEWEYERAPGEPLLPARMSARAANGVISLISGPKGNGAPGQKISEAKQGKQKLPKYSC